MDGKRFEDYYSEDDLDKKVEMLNAFISEYSPWQLTHANKDHGDLFGETIERGERYYKRRCGVAYDDVLKLSQLSMARMCHALFRSASFLESIAEQILKNRAENLQKEMKKLTFHGFPKKSV